MESNKLLAAVKSRETEESPVLFIANNPNPTILGIKFISFTVHLFSITSYWLEFNKLVYSSFLYFISYLKGQLQGHTAMLPAFAALLMRGEHY